MCKKPLIFLVAALLPLPAFAVPAFVFTTPDAVLPAGPGDGLNGEVWTGVDVDTLAATRAFVGANPADATFTATVVDYPNGPTPTVSASSTDFDTALGVDAGSLSNPAVGTTAVLNSIMRFQGFLGVSAPGSLFLGIGSDDGSELLIQGTQVLDNDGIHAFPGAGPVEIGFATPGLYQLDLLFFESQVVDWGIEFYLDNPRAGSPVPQSMLYTSTRVPEPSAATLIVAGLLALACRRRS